MLTAVHLTICKFVKDSLELYMISVKGKAIGLDHFFQFWRKYDAVYNKSRVHFLCT